MKLAMKYLIFLIICTWCMVNALDTCYRDVGQIKLSTFPRGYSFDRVPPIVPDGRMVFRRGLIFVSSRYRDWACLARSLASSGTTVYVVYSETSIYDIVKERLDVQFWTFGGHADGAIQALHVASRNPKLNRSYMDGNVGWIGIDAELASIPNIRLSNMAATHLYTQDGNKEGFHKMPLHAISRHLPYDSQALTYRCNERLHNCTHVHTELVSYFTQAVGQQNQYDALNSAYKYISLMDTPPVLYDGHWELLNGTASKALVFYPGAKIDSRAYIPLLDRVRQHGYDVYLIIVPLGSAFIQPETTDRFISLVPKLCSYDAISVAGHSLGGTGAGYALLQNTHNVKGFFSLAGTFLVDISDRSEKMAITYGTRDGLFLGNAPGQISRMNSDTVITLIQGGNHHQCVSYDFLDFGDYLATIGPKDQQDQVLSSILTHIQSL